MNDCDGARGAGVVHTKYDYINMNDFGARHFLG